MVGISEVVLGFPSTGQIVVLFVFSVLEIATIFLCWWDRPQPSAMTEPLLTIEVREATWKTVFYTVKLPSFSSSPSSFLRTEEKKA